MSKNIELSVVDIENKLWCDIRNYRNQLLAQCDIEINKLEDSGGDASKWRSYRSELREIPQKNENPFSILWPSKP